ncbi:MAG: hypothetical protein ABI561_04275 [Bradyrhizobium sp.]
MRIKPEMKASFPSRECRACANFMHAHSEPAKQRPDAFAPGPNHRTKLQRLMMPEYRKQQDDRQGNSDQPKQRTSTETHVSLHLLI